MLYRRCRASSSSAERAASVPVDGPRPTAVSLDRPRIAGVGRGAPMPAPPSASPVLAPRSDRRRGGADGAATAVARGRATVRRTRPPRSRSAIVHRPRRRPVSTGPSVPPLPAPPFHPPLPFPRPSRLSAAARSTCRQHRNGDAMSLLPAAEGASAASAAPAAAPAVATTTTTATAAPGVDSSMADELVAPASPTAPSGDERPAASHRPKGPPPPRRARVAVLRRGGGAERAHGTELWWAAMGREGGRGP